MLFNSQIFLLVFLPLVLLLYYRLNSVKQREFALFVVSLIFYAWWDLRFLPVLIFSILVNWGIVHLFRNKPYVLSFTILANLCLLAIYKYLNFFSESLTFLIGKEFPQFSVALPLGISFFTFQQISYLVDLKRKEAQLYSLLDYGFYISFFPQLIAGPIVRHNELLPQLKNILQVNYKEISTGILLLTIGLIKKLFIADTLAPIVNTIYETAKVSSVSFPEALFAIIGFGFQIYFDFSGYSDMAVGLGKMFGFNLPSNFNSPYRALSIRDFWQKWHMTLSSFLRDYLYIPLGGNRKGKLRQYVNLFATMSLAGLWHGAGWTFVVWGGLHGMALVVNHAWHKNKIKLPSFTGWLITMLFVFITWVLFRSENFSQANNILLSLFNMNFSLQQIDLKQFWFLLPATIIVAYKFTSMGIIERIKLNHWWGLMIGFILTLCVLQSGAQSAIEFIYFQF